MDRSDSFETQQPPPSLIAELSQVDFSDVHEIGHGGFGVVFRCIQGGLARTVAVKVLTVDLHEESRARFLREQQAMSRLTGHPNVLPILQAGTTGAGHPYIVMPYCRLDSLAAQVRKSGPLALDQALRLGIKIAGALESAHRFGILHRDVKPANIMLTDYGEPALGDFGIAHIEGGFETAAGAFLGSPAYTAPEVLNRGTPTSASDIYGLGATLFSALTGHAAFERRSGERVMAQFVRIKSQQAPTLQEYGIPEGVSAVISRAMSRRPGDRPATVFEFGTELRQLQRNYGFPVDEMALQSKFENSGNDQWPASADIYAGLSPRRGPARLPEELTSFVGRRHELAEAKNLLSRVRLVTLTGLGGVGKTRLALRTAALVQHKYVNGVVLVELGELRDGTLVNDAVAASLGVRNRSAKPSQEGLIEYLATREMLLVFDNCEHVLAAVAQLVGPLLRGSARVKILATSREPLAIEGEVVLRVSPLSVPGPDRKPSLRALTKYEAVTLFIERAIAALPEFTLTEENAAQVAGICHQLDGLPLPIELATARLRAMSPQQILQRLTDRYTLLTRGSRDAPTRQQTMRLCVDWSFELCTAQEQLAWKRLTVFAGNFELDAAEGVCGADLAKGELLDIVTSLVDKSILIREVSEERMRYRILDTLRDYGLAKLASTTEHIQLRRRHRDWYEALARGAENQWISARQLDWIARLNREQSNLREALEFTVDDNPAAGLRLVNGLYWLWVSQGRYNECRRWLDQLLTRQSGRPNRTWIKALYFASLMANVQGDFQTATKLVHQGRSLIAQSSDRLMLALVDCAEGQLVLYRGDLTRASSLLESAVGEFSQDEESALEISVLYGLGLAYGLAGLTVQSLDCLERILAITERAGEKVYRSHSLWAMAIVVWQQGNVDRAVLLLEESLGIARGVHDPRVATACIETLAWIAYGQGDATRAAVLVGAAEALANSMGSAAIIHSNLLVHHRDCMVGAKRTLGDRAFGVANSRGQRLGFDAAVAYALHEQRSTASVSDDSTRLTARELQIASLIADGMTNRAIAERLVISHRTVQGHVEHILTKLGFISRTQVASWVAERAHA